MPPQYSHARPRTGVPDPHLKDEVVIKMRVVRAQYVLFVLSREKEEQAHGSSEHESWPADRHAPPSFD